MLSEGLAGPPVVEEPGIRFGLIVVSTMFADLTTPLQTKKLYPKLALIESVIMYPALVFNCGIIETALLPTSPILLDKA